MKNIEGLILMDRPGYLAGGVAILEDLERLMREAEITFALERPASIPEALTYIRPPERNGATRVVFGVTNGEYGGSAEQALVEQMLSTLPHGVLFIFVTVGIDSNESVQAWFEHLIKDHPAYGRTFAVMREYAQESFKDEFTKCMELLIGS